MVIATTLVSKGVILYLFRLLMVYVMRKGRINNNILQSITHHNNSTTTTTILPSLTSLNNSSLPSLTSSILNKLILDTPSLTSEKDDFKQLTLNTLHNIGIIDSSSLTSTLSIFPKQEQVLKHYNKCKKCGYSKLHKGQVRESGGLLSQIFNIQNRMFITTSCDRCSFTEYFETNQNSFTDYLTMALK